LSDDKPRPAGKTDLEQLQGVWELKVKEDGVNYVLRLSFQDPETAGFDILRPVDLNALPSGGLTEGTGDTAVRYRPAFLYGMSYKLTNKGGERVIAIGDCLAFPTKGADLPFEFKDGELVIKCKKLKLEETLKVDRKRLVELDLSGTWKRTKAP
jgi:hypothetical protein